MNNLYEYIDPIASPYEAFCCGSGGEGFPIPAHWHYYVELLYIKEGRVRVSMDNEVKVCTQGCIVFFPPKCVHAIEAFGKEEQVRYDVVKFDLSCLPAGKAGDLNLRASLQVVRTSAYPCCFATEVVQAMELRPLFEEIVEEYKGQAYASSMIVTADICKIMGKLVRRWQEEGYFLPAPGIHPSYEISFDRISEYIDSHYFEELTAEKLASMCNMSHSTFSMNFYRRYGKTCKEYITATRINVAENMLLFSNYDVSFIAREVGYSDCSYFIRCYKKRKGITPKQARTARIS